MKLYIYIYIYICHISLKNLVLVQTLLRITETWTPGSWYFKPISLYRRKANYEVRNFENI